MKHRDEIHLWQRIQNTTHEPFDAIPLRDLCAELGMSEHRGAYLVNKWAREGFVDWGVSPMGPWLTDKGVDATIGLYGFTVNADHD